MPPQTSKPKSSLAGRLGAKAAEAVQKHANDDTKYGFINLPPGIDDGVAVLTQCYFSQYEKGDNKGKEYFRAVGNVLEPLTATSKSGGKMRVAGLQTSVMVPLCDTKNSKGEITPQEKYIDDVMNHLRMLGGKDYTAGATIDDLESLAEGLLNPDTPVYFKFTTSPRLAQKDEGGVKKGDVTGAWENWHGAIEGYIPDEVAPAVNDATPQAPKQTAPSSNGNGKPAPGKAVQPTATKPAAKKPEPVEEIPPFVPETCEDLDMLLADAESDSDTNSTSQERIKDLGIEAGIDEKAQSNLPTWTAVVEAIREAQSGADGTEEQSEGLKVNDWVGYHPRNLTTKKKEKNAVRCLVTSVGEDTATLKAGKAVYKNIPLTDLVDDPGE